MGGLRAQHSTTSRFPQADLDRLDFWLHLLAFFRRDEPVGMYDE
jgi:hypothetical protein